MTNQELIYVKAIIDLSFAIKENDLEKVKNLVNIINSNITDERYLNDELGLNNLEFNDSFLYVLDNLKQINNAELYKWISKINNLIEQYQITNNDIPIITFINNYINDINNLQQFKILSLIRLCHIIQNYNLLNQIQ